MPRDKIKLSKKQKKESSEEESKKGDKKSVIQGKGSRD